MYGTPGGKYVYEGAFVSLYNKAKAFGSTAPSQKMLIEGKATWFDVSGEIVDKEYLVNGYATRYIGVDRHPSHLAYTERTGRYVLLAPAMKERAAVKVRATGLPDFQFVLPRPDPVVKKLFNRERA